MQVCKFDPMYRHDGLLSRTAEEGRVIMKFEGRFDKLVKRTIIFPTEASLSSTASFAGAMTL